MEDLNKALIVHESESFPQNDNTLTTNNNTTVAARIGSVSKQVALSTPLSSGVLAQRTGKRGRGRPRGTGKLQMISNVGGDFEKTATKSFTMHNLTVNAGEDVISKIFSLINGHKVSACILSATGFVSSAIIQPPGATAGVRFEGRFGILTFSGTCTFNGGGAHEQGQNGMLAITLAKPDGTTFGGGLDLQGTLIAADPIQLVVCSYKKKPNNKKQRRDVSVAATPSGGGAPDNNAIRQDLNLDYAPVGDA